MNKQINTEKFPVLSYTITGKGPTIILLHGFPASKKLWNEIVPSLSQGFTVIAPDIPGFGESTFAADTLSMEDIAESVKIILDNEDSETALIAGHSMGGYAALAFAELYPKKTSGLSMVHSSAYADDESKKENRRKAIELIRKGGKEAFIRQMIPHLFSGVYKETHPEIIEQQLKVGMKTDLKGLIAAYEAMIERPDRTSIIKKATFPLQWIIGRHDNLLPFDKALEQSHMNNINFVSTYACGHMSMLECPKELAYDLRNFANQVANVNLKD